MELSVGIMDSQRVKWGNNVSLNGADGNKKVKAIKRHVIVDKNGFLIAVMVTIANMHDSKAVYLLMRVLKEMCSGIKVILTDGGYRGEVIDTIKKKFGYIIQVVLSACKEQGFRPIQKRWIVERTFSWMDYNRRLCRNYELTFDSAEEMAKLATSGRYLVVSNIFDLECSNYEFYLIDYGYSKFNKKYTFWNNVHDF